MEAFPTGRFPSSWKLSPQLAQSDEVATAFGGGKMVNDHPGGRTGQKGQGEEERNAGVVEKVFDRRALFRAKRGNM